MLAPNKTSPPYVATTDAVPGGNKFVLMLAVPPERVNTVPFGEAPIDARIAPLPSSAFNATASVPNGAGVTVTFAVNVVPEGVPPFGFDNVVVVAVREIDPHKFSRFTTLIDPSPVARS